MNYAKLKKLILKIESLALRQATAMVSEGADEEAEALRRVFWRTLGEELCRTQTFFGKTRLELLAVYEQLCKEVHRYEQAQTAVATAMVQPDRTRCYSVMSVPEPVTLDVQVEEDEGDVVIDDEAAHLLPQSHRATDVRSIWSSPDLPEVPFVHPTPGHTSPQHEQEAIRSKATLLYIQLYNLVEYVSLNYCGFQKILKKYDKRANVPWFTRHRAASEGFETSMGRDVSTAPTPILPRSNDANILIDVPHDTVQHDAPSHMSTPILPPLPPAGHSLTTALMPTIDALFADMRSAIAEDLQPAMHHLIDLYADVCCHGDKAIAMADLARLRRDRIVWDRNTIWRDMMAMERRTTGAHAVDPIVGGLAMVPSDHVHTIPPWQRWRQLVLLGLCVAVFVAILCAPPLLDDSDGMGAMKQRCLGVFVFSSMLWALEVFPLFVTSLFIPFLVVLLGVLGDPAHPGRPLPAKEAATLVFHTMFSQVIGLLLGGFAIAGSLSKFDIAKMTAVAMLRRSGSRPNVVLFANMVVACFASMWISNVAAPVLCYGIMMPVLRAFPAGHEFAKALVLGIALASNIGGMASPISSPQNIFALEHLESVGWVKWFAVSMPVCTACLVLCWAVLVLVYKPHKVIEAIPPIRTSAHQSWTWQQIMVVTVSVVTIGLWCCNSAMQPYTGEMGVLALIPLILFFGFGLLTKEDLNAFLWNVVLLAMGGLVLGFSVKESGLLKSLAEGIKVLVKDQSVFSVLCVFGAMMLCVATLISHTVSAMVILPIIQKVGQHIAMERGYSKEATADLLILGSVFICSGAMGLPVSGFPNMTGFSLEDATGKTYVKTLDFVKTGIPSSILVYMCIITFGYILMMAVI